MNILVKNMINTRRYEIKPYLAALFQADIKYTRKCVPDVLKQTSGTHDNGWAGTVVDLDLGNLPTKKSLGETWEVEPDQLQFAMCI